jgi:hypothetical protein
MSFEERVELYDKMVSWYYGQGNGLLLTPVARELYLNAKVNLICMNKELRLNFRQLGIRLNRPDNPTNPTPEELGRYLEERDRYLENLDKELDKYLRSNLKNEQLDDYLSSARPKQEEKLWRGSLSMDQLSLLRAQMRADIKVFGLAYKLDLGDLEKAFLEAANVDLWKRPWRKPLTMRWKKRWAQARVQRDQPIAPYPEQAMETQNRQWSHYI